MTPAKTKRKLIFISHSAEADKDIASELQQFFLRAYGGNVEVFVSSIDGIACGSTPQKTLEQKLSAADVIVVVLTKKGIQSAWVTFEVGFVAGHKGKVIPLLFDGLITDVQKPIQQFFQIKIVSEDNALAGALAEIDIAVNDHHRVEVGELRDRILNRASKPRPFMPRPFSAPAEPHI